MFGKSLMYGVHKSLSIFLPPDECVSAEIYFELLDAGSAAVSTFEHQHVCLLVPALTNVQENRLHSICEVSMDDGGRGGLLDGYRAEAVYMSRVSLPGAQYGTAMYHV